MPDTRKREGGLVQSIPPLPEVEDARLSFQEQMRALRELFGLPENPLVGEMALGFGVGSIGRVPPRIFGGRPAKKPFKKQKPSAKIEGQELFGEPNLLERQKMIGREQSVKKTGQENIPFEPFGSEQLAFEFSRGLEKGTTRNIGGQRPSTATLEAKAAIAQTQKLIQTRVKGVQKDLDRLAIAEANPLAPQSLIQEIAKKGLRAKATHQIADDTIVISFKSKDAIVDVSDEFVILSTPDGPVLAVNFNSPTIKSKLRPKFKAAFPKKFLADEIGAEFQPGELQRMAGETAKDAPPPDNFSYYNLKNFEDGLQVINKMLDIAHTEKAMTPIKKQLDAKLDDLLKTFERIVKEGEKPKK